MTQRFKFQDRFGIVAFAYRPGVSMSANTFQITCVCFPQNIHVRVAAGPKRGEVTVLIVMIGGVVHQVPLLYKSPNIAHLKVKLYFTIRFINHKKPK